MKLVKKPLCIIVPLFAVLYLAPLGVRELFSPDETRYAEIGREMLTRGDWVTPYLNGVTYFEKPILSAWLFALSEKLFGENAFAVRFPSAFAVLLSALLLYLFCRKFSEGGKREALISSVFFLLIPLVYGLGTAATTDPILLFFLTAGLTSFYAAVRAERKGETVLYLFLFGLAAGTAFLTKGFIAFVLPGLSIAAYLIWSRKFREIFLYPWLPLLVAFLVIVPWAYLIHKAQPDFWHYFIYEEHIKRFLEKEQHPEPFWFFIPIIIGGFGFFLLYLPQAVRGIKSNCFKNDFYRYNLCWIVFPFLFLSASSGKLPTYILPCFAPAAVLFGAGIRRDMLEDGRTGWYDGISKFFAVLLLLAAAGMTAIQLWNPSWVLYSRHEVWKWILFAAATAGSSVLIAVSVSRKEVTGKLQWFCAALVLSYFLFPFVVPDFFMLNKSACRLLETVKPNLPKQTVLISFRYPFQDVCWVLKRDDVLMYENAGELKEGLQFMKRMDRVLSIPETGELIRRERSKRGVVLVLPEYIYEEDMKRLPKPKKIEKLPHPNSRFIAVIF